MKKIILIGCLMSLGALLLPAQESDLEALKRALQEQQKVIQSLLQKVEALEKQQAGVTNDQAELKRLVAAPPPVTSSPPPMAKAWSPSDPIRLAGGGQNYLNLSFDGLFAVGTSTAKEVEGLETGGHDPKQRGFTVENIETTFEGKIDPYFRGQAAIVYQIDPAGESFLELEEAYLESLSLPGNLQLRAGQFFTEFGRQNQTHPHTWDFADQPLVMGRFLGDDGLRSAGARLSWLTPTPFYSELFLTVQNSQGPTVHSFRNENEGEPFFGRPSVQGPVKTLGDMLFAPRYVTSFNLSDSQTIVAGASGAFGNNGTGGSTEIYAVDLFWKWKPANQDGGFPFVSWATEGMVRCYKAGAFNWDLNGDGALDADEMVDAGTGAPASLPRETLTDYGFYSQVLYGFRKGWVAGLRGDYVAPTERGRYENILGSPDLDRAERWRISPNLTWYPTEFSKFRLQYNYDHRDHLGEDHSIWLQFEFLLGAHGAHKF